MSEIANTLDKSVAAAKANYIAVDMRRVEAFLAKQTGAKVEISETGGGAAKSGSSSGIVIFSASINGAANKYVLRYDPQSEQRLFVEYDLGAEFRLLAALQGSGLPVPAIIGLDESGDELGVSGFIMECVPGEPIPTSLFADGLLVEANEKERQGIYRSILSNLAKLHNLDPAELGLDGFSKNAPGNNPQQRLINWWWNTWEWAKPESYDRLLPLRDWLLKNAPEISDPVLMHGDPNLGNYLVHQGEVSAMLDWELSSIGAPELDLAIQIISMGPHRAMTDHLPVAPPTEQEWLQMYAALGGKPLGDLSYYKVHAAYEVLICMGSMTTYMPDEISAQYEGMMDFYWAVAEQIMTDRS